MENKKKSSFCATGSCVEVAIKSSYCGTSTCVEVDKVSTLDTIFVYDAHGNHCMYDFEEWRAFILGVKNNEFDV